MLDPLERAWAWSQFWLLLAVLGLAVILLAPAPRPRAEGERPIRRMTHAEVIRARAELGRPGNRP